MKLFLNTLQILMFSRAFRLQWHPNPPTFSSQKVLAKHGATKISAYVTHGIFPNRSWERFEHDNGGMNTLFQFHPTYFFPL